MKHLSDNMIQEYLDSSKKKYGEEVREHILFCNSCQEKLEKYAELYDHLAVEPKFDLGWDFNQKVLKKLEKRTANNTLLKVLPILAASLGIVLVLFTLDQLEVISLQTIFAAVSDFVMACLVPTSDTVAKFITQLNGNFAVLVFAGLAAILFNLFDRMLIQSRFNRL